MSKAPRDGEARGSGMDSHPKGCQCLPHRLLRAVEAKKAAKAKDKGKA